MTIADHRYVLVTTFRRNGDPVSSPVWIAPLPGGGAGFTTDGRSGKAKRLRNSDRVTLQPCDARGKIDAAQPVVEATARLVTGAEAEPVAAAIQRKYGLQVTLIDAFYKVRSFVTRSPAAESAAVVVTLPE